MKYPREVELREWSLQAIDNAGDKLAKVLEGVVLEAANQAVTLAFADNCADFYLPFLGKFDGVTDPLELHLMVPLCDEKTDGPTWRTNLATIVREGIENEDDPERRQRVAVALRELADELEGGSA